MKEIKAHPLAELFPLMPASDIKELADDIKQRGLQNPITLYEGEILDGRHRYEACLIAEVKPLFDHYKGNDPLGYVIAANLKRRHLTTSQKAMVAAKIANMPQGRPEIKPANLPVKQSTAAETLAVSDRSLRTAKTLLEESPKLANQVTDGKISLNAASEKLAEQKAKTETVVDKIGYPIPHALVPLWRRSQEAQDVLTSISRIRGTLRDAQESKDPLWREVNFSGALADLGRAYTALEAGKPYAVCPDCQGRVADRCAGCRGRGFISEFRWNNTTTKEAKELRRRMLEKAR